MSDAWGTLSVPPRATGAEQGYAGLDGAVGDGPTAPAARGCFAATPQAADTGALETDPELLRRYRHCATWCGCLVAAIGCTGLIGWLTGVMALVSFSSAWPAMRQNTALSLIAAGSALALHGVRGNRRYSALLIARLCTVFILAIVGASMAEVASDNDLGIDHMIVGERFGTAGMAYPGRMAPLTALIFFLFSVALLTIALPRSRWRVLSPTLAVLATVAAMVVLLGYMFGASELYTVAGRFTAVSANAAVAFFLLGNGIVFASLPAGPLRSLASPYLGGMMLRRMLPLIVVMMTVVVWLRLLAQSWGLFDSIEFGAASASVVLMISVAYILSWYAGVLDRLDHARRHSDEQVRQLNVALSERVRALESANREFQGFSYSMSHVLRSPLRAIHGYAQVIQDDFGESLGANGQRLLGAVQSSAEELSDLLDGILAFLHLGWQHMTLAPLDMRQEVLTAITLLQGRTAGRDISFEVGDLPAAQADASMVRRIWLNLLDNAVKFTGSTGAARIEIGAQADGGRTGSEQTTYFVKDNGAGFDMQYVAKLFGIFQRLHQTTQFPGTGIGLAIVNRIVTRHGGRAWAEGRPGEGSTFYFSLPSAEATHV